MARKIRQKKNPTKELLDGLPKEARAWVALVEHMQKEAREAYEKFFERAKALPPVERAEAWLRHVVEHPDNDGDLEGIVYLASRGYDCSAYISRTISEWKEAEAESLKENASALKIPEFLANDIQTSSSLFLRNFWTCHRSQEDAIDATMLRTVEWCGIGGFEPWWQRLARSAKEAVLKGGMDSFGACFWLFNMCRSRYAISLMPRVLDRCLETLELCDEYQAAPWIQTAERGEIPHRRLCHVAHMYYAASIAFCTSMLRPEDASSELVVAAAKTLQKHQMSAGPWGYWADLADHPSIEVTAAGIHALSAVKPQGYNRNLKGASDWLLAQQDAGGFWREQSCPDPTYLTVFVLDALALTQGGDTVTFRAPTPTVKSTVLPFQASSHGHRFKVALSFPGEARLRVAEIAELLGAELGRESVFYDSWYRAELARPNLDLYLQEIYRNQSDLLVLFLCEDYEKKEWCGLEWRAIRDLIKAKQDNRVMFLRLDDSPIRGILSIDGYLRIRDLPSADVAAAILARAKS
jgi:hypothetical protein